MNKKIISGILATLIASATLTTSVQAKELIKKNTSNNIKVFKPIEIKTFEDIMRISHPTNPGTMDIIAQDTVWKHGVHQPTSFGVAVNLISGFLGITGLAAISENVTANYLAGQLAGTTLSLCKLYNIVNIKFDRYKLRGANGRIYHKVYASYYKLDGTFITSKLCQDY